MDRLNRIIVEEEEKWTDWTNKIPALQFPEAWSIRIIPPYCGAMVRFIVNDTVSVYLDVYENLGFFGGQPYWEVHPYQDDIYRIAMDDTHELIERIPHILSGEYPEEI